MRRGEKALERGQEGSYVGLAQLVPQLVGGRPLKRVDSVPLARVTARHTEKERAPMYGLPM